MALELAVNLEIRYLAEQVEEPVHERARALHLAHHPGGVVGHPAGEPEAVGVAVHGGAEPDALDGAGDPEGHPGRGGLGRWRGGDGGARLRWVAGLVDNGPAVTY